MSLLLPALILYVAVVGTFGGPVAWMWRQRAAWQRWEWASGFAPFLFWTGLALVDDRGKTLSNLVAEPIGLALVVAVIAWCRVALAPVLGPAGAATCAAVVSVVAAWLVWWAVPALPE